MRPCTHVLPKNMHTDTKTETAFFAAEAFVILECFYVGLKETLMMNP